MISGLGAILASRRRTPASNPVYDAWVAAVDAAGGTYETDSKAIALDLVEQLQAATFYSKIIWMLPLLGANLAAARVPLIDVLNVGIATNHGFVDADFDQATGLHGNAANWLDTLIQPASLGASNNAGFGWWPLDLGAAGGWSFACQSSNGSGQIFGLYFITTRRLFYYGDGSSPVDIGGAAGPAHYYGQRESAILRTLYQNAVSIGTDTDSQPTSGANTTPIRVCSLNAAAFTDARTGLAYLTSGDLTPTEVTALHTLLGTHLMTPTGR